MGTAAPGARSRGALARNTAARREVDPAGRSVRQSAATGASGRLGQVCERRARDTPARCGVSPGAPTECVELRDGPFEYSRGAATATDERSSQVGSASTIMRVRAFRHLFQFPPDSRRRREGTRGSAGFLCFPPRLSRACGCDALQQCDACSAIRARSRGRHLPTAGHVRSTATSPISIRLDSTGDPRDFGDRMGVKSADGAGWLVEVESADRDRIGGSGSNRVLGIASGDPVVGSSGRVD